MVRKSATFARPTCIARNSYFTRSPDKWSLPDYVTFQYPKCKNNPSPKRWILGAWTAALKKITTCQNQKCSGNLQHLRAGELLESFHIKGSDNCKAAGLDAIRVLKNVPISVKRMVNVSNTGNFVYRSSLQHVNQSASGNPPAEDEEDYTESSVDPYDPDVINEEFESAFSSFDPARKWVLPSGAIVENILHHAFSEKPPADVRDCILNWTIDVDNKYMQNLFTSEDWQSIRAEAKALPPVPQPFAQELVARFGQVKTTDHLRSILESSSAIDSDDANAFDLRWARRVIQDFLDLFECNALVDLSQYGEHWFDTQVWGPILDKCMLSLPDVVLNRAEIKSKSYVQRRNRGRADVSQRLKSGPSLDGVFRDRRTREAEFGLIECSPLRSGGEYSTKWITDVKKMRKPMRDMLGQLATQVNYNRQVVDHLEVFGICTSALAIQVSRMTQPKGYVFLLTADGAESLPQNFTQLRNLLRVISLVVRTKRAMVRSIEAFRSAGLSSSDSDMEALLGEILGVGALHKHQGTVLPPTADTPSP